uniref:Uncharacterized protein n=1 Tax=Anguilla anguilla TaxID=7936 RepID=A0A0E9QUZ5_ANGAN
MFVKSKRSDGRITPSSYVSDNPQRGVWLC